MDFSSDLFSFHKDLSMFQLDVVLKRHLFQKVYRNSITLKNRCLLLKILHHPFIRNEFQDYRTALHLPTSRLKFGRFYNNGFQY